MPERDYGLADIALKRGQMEGARLRDLASLRAQSMQNLAQINARADLARGERMSDLTKTLALIGTKAVGDWQDQQQNQIVNAQKQQAFERQQALDQVAQQQAATRESRDATTFQQGQETRAKAQNKDTILAEAYKVSQGPDGKLRRDVFQNMLTNVGLGEASSAIFKGLDDAERANADMQTAQEKLKELQLKYGQTLGQQIQAVNYDPIMTNGIFAMAESHGHGQEVDQFRQLRQQDEGKFRAAVDQIALGPETRADLEKQADNVRADAAAKEAARHNRAMEATAGEGGALVQIAGPNGQPIWVTKKDAIGQPSAQPARGVTGIERQSLAFYNRAKEADQIAAAIDPEIGKMGLASQARLQYAPNPLQSEQNQSYRQAQRAFTEARLRKESGAAIPEQEYANDAKTYFAQPGDGPAMIAQKVQGRQRVLDGLAFSSGKAYEEYYGEPLRSAKGAASGVTTPAKANVTVDAPAPANVVAALKSEKPGRHTLSDGSVWNKLPDGSIVRGGG